jgi:DNA invertase Pin-like site-specific DNA recombinase
MFLRERKAKKYVAYYRVSTERQGRSGLGLDAQKKAVADYIAQKGGKLVSEYREVESGKRVDRPELEEALVDCRIHKAELVIAKMDRLARNVAFISNLLESDVEFVAVDFPKANRLTVHILAAVAEHEREMISIRTKDALAAAKARGVILGNPENLTREAQRKGTQRSAEVRKKAARSYALDVLKKIEKIRKDGITTLNGIARELTSIGVETPRGKSHWQATQVKAVLERAAT